MIRRIKAYEGRTRVDPKGVSRRNPLPQASTSSRAYDEPHREGISTLSSERGQARQHCELLQREYQGCGGVGRLCLQTAKKIEECLKEFEIELLKIL